MFINNQPFYIRIIYHFFNNIVNKNEQNRDLCSPKSGPASGVKCIDTVDRWTFDVNQWLFGNHDALLYGHSVLCD